MDIGRFFFALWSYILHFWSVSLLFKLLILTPAFWIEFPLYFIMIIFNIVYYFKKTQLIHNYPPIGVIITAYKESLLDILKNIRTLIYQTYPGYLEILLVVDSPRNDLSLLKKIPLPHNRKLGVIVKNYRGGRSSSLNLGLKMLSERIRLVLAIDADTSLNSDALVYLVQPFNNSDVIAVSGNLRVRNIRKSIWTVLQHIEYSISITLTRIFLSKVFGTVNNISGAYGIFRRDFLDLIYGWDSGSAEDLDLTNRIKIIASYYKDAKIAFAYQSIAYTSVPTTLKGIIEQRRRWDGDLVWIFFSKYYYFFKPLFLNWKESLLVIILNLLHQFILPFLMVIYNLFLFFKFGLLILLVVNVFILLVYFCWSIFLYVSYILCCSNDVKIDISLLPYTLLYPFYAIILRFNAVRSFIADFIFKEHKNSSYVPKWVSNKLPF